MESIAYIYHSSPLAGAEFSTLGKLRLQQSMPLPHKGIHTIYNVSYLIAEYCKEYAFLYCKRSLLFDQFCYPCFEIKVLTTFWLFFQISVIDGRSSKVEAYNLHDIFTSYIQRNGIVYCLSGGPVNMSLIWVGVSTI